MPVYMAWSDGCYGEMPPGGAVWATEELGADGRSLCGLRLGDHGDIDHQGSPIGIEGNGDGS